MIVEQKNGVEGTFQITVRNKEGVRFQTDTIKNMVLDNGLHYLMGFAPKNNLDALNAQNLHHFMAGLVVGSGNSQPQATDIKLANFLTHSSPKNTSGLLNYEAPNSEHPNHVKIIVGQSYYVDNLAGQNVTEVGLVSKFDEYSKEYVLMTRSLIKDNEGTPITITVLENEVLEVNYKVHFYIDVSIKTGSFTLSKIHKKENITETFDYRMQLVNVSRNNQYGYSNFVHNLPLSITSHTDRYVIDRVESYSEEIVDTNYDLMDPKFNVINIETSNLHDLFPSFSVSSVSIYNKTYDPNFMSILPINSESTEDKSKVVITVSCGFNAHVHENGIRAFMFDVNSNGGILFRPLIIVKNRDNNKGIQKTNRHIWNFDVEITLSRWDKN